VQFGQHHGITSICLDARASLARDQRGRHHVARLAKLFELVVDLVPTTSGLVTEVHDFALRAESFDQLFDFRGCVGNFAKILRL
jgi:hypothetical protein